MKQWFKQLDSILRGDATQISALKGGRIDMPVSGLVAVAVLLAVIYGLCMGAFALMNHDAGYAFKQMLSTAVKFPMLFVLTLVVTFPSLYVFNALVGSRLSMQSVLRLLIAAFAVMMAVLASLGPIVVFFTISTTSYPFMKLLNVAICSVSGFLGMAFLLRTLHRLVLVQDAVDRKGDAGAIASEDAPASDQVDAADDAETIAASQGMAGEYDAFGPLTRREDMTDQRAKLVFQIWVMVFAFVGAQMSWVLRPFIGHPSHPFAFLRGRQSNFFMDVLQSLAEILGG